MGSHAGRVAGELIPIAVRPLGPEDVGYVFQTWAISSRDAYRTVEGKDYLDGLRAHLQVLLGGAKPRLALVAHPPETPTVIVGWAVGEPPKHVDYVYVRAEYRHGKVATRLLQEGGFDLTCLETTTRTGPAATAIARSHGIRMRAVF